jgi:selenocysteine lyase/cysteine desulfurase/rhodanese-related sulfurtransferase
VTPASANAAGLRSYDELCADAKTRIREIAPEELEDRVARGGLVLLDVREPEEFAMASIPGAGSLPRGLMEKFIADAVPEPDAEVVLYCQSGKRSALAADTLGRMGYRAVRSLAGGIDRWIASGRGTQLGAVTVAAAGPVDGVDHRDWTSIRRDFPIAARMIRTLDGLERFFVYLDHAASTHPPSSVVAEYSTFLEREYANVHRASYALAREATNRFEEAFRTCGEFVGGRLGPNPDDHCVVFTGNTTTGLDLVAHCVADLPGTVVVTELEHHSNDLPFRRRGGALRVRMTPEGRLDLEHLASILKKERVKLVTVCGAANVTGWMAPLRAIARLAHEAGAMICVDAAQLIAHAPIRMVADDPAESIDFLVAAGHKAYAPFGAGFVIGPRGVLDAAPPYLPGGGTAAAVTVDGVAYLPSPDRHHGGTPNIAGAIGFAAMLRYLGKVGMDRVREHEMELLRYAWDGLRKIDGITLYGPPDLDERVGIISFNVAGVNDMLAAAVLGEEFAVAVRNGRFCAHVHADRLFAAQGGCTPAGDGPPSAVRASFGIFNDLGDVERLLEGVRTVQAREWKGSYRMTGRGVQTERNWHGRCADAWMEGAGEEDSHA